MSLQGINVAVLSGAADDVFDLVSGFDGMHGLGAGPENDRAILEQLIKTRNMVAQNLGLIVAVYYLPTILKMLTMLSKAVILQQGQGFGNTVQKRSCT